MAKDLRHFDGEDKDLGYDHIWVIVDKGNFVQTSCWSKTYRDSWLKEHPTHVAIRYEKRNSSDKIVVATNGSPSVEVDIKS